MAVSDSIDITFVYEADDIIEVPVRVQLLGRTADRDRPLAITVDSENAEEGKDYLLPENQGKMLNVFQLFAQLRIKHAWNL